MHRRSLLKDMVAVVDALELNKLALYGGVAGAFRALDYAAHYPHKVDRLVVWSTFSRLGDAFPPEMLRGLAALARANWDLCARTLADIGLRRRSEELGLQLAEVYKQSSSGEVGARLIEDNLDEDLTPVLSRIDAPTLVVHALRSPLGPVTLSQKVAAAIPNARFLLLPEPASLVARDIAGPDQIVSFLNEGLAIVAPTEDVAGPDIPSSMTAIMFADIVDSTALTERLGDAAFRAKARELDAALRAIIREHSGTAIEGKLLGDGVLAVFTSAREGIAAAMVCAMAGGQAGLPLHLGLHAGDVIREDNNVYGGAVNIASRISGLSAPGEVLVSETVRSLARTSAGVRFEDRGEQALKGVGEAVRVWAVVAQEPGARIEDQG
jgi:class 3 adenylate cyclase